METPIQALGKYKLPKTLSGEIETETFPVISKWEERKVWKETELKLHWNVPLKAAMHDVLTSHSTA